VKLGRGGLVDVEFLTQTLQLVHGASHPEVRAPSTRGALAGLARAGVLSIERAATLSGHYRFLRRVSAATRLLGARPADVLELDGPMPARVATAVTSTPAARSARTCQSEMAPTPIRPARRPPGEAIS
jgi:glutamate-ammonia-ligase adenylyltransferase